MLRLADYDIVFQEVPDETTLALNLSECPHCCPGCHSPQLRSAIGELLTVQKLDELLCKYPYVTCVSLMGGDGDPEGVKHVASYIKQGGRKVSWYSGRTALPTDWPLEQFDFIKIGPYVESLGPLKSRTTNQRFYRVENKHLVDCTSYFWK